VGVGVGVGTGQYMYRGRPKFSFISFLSFFQSFEVGLSLYKKVPMMAFWMAFVNCAGTKYKKYFVLSELPSWRLCD